MKRVVTARAALLQALSWGDGYGLELIRRVHERTHGLVVLRDGTVYPLLRELERDGFVTGRGDEDRHGGARPGRVYSLTPQGCAEVAAHRRIMAALMSAG